MAGAGNGPGFGEGMQRSFALDDAVAYRRLMLDIYGARCAVTGHVHAAGPSHEALEVFLLQPLAHGGEMNPGNAIVVEPVVAGLLDKGDILISDDYLVYVPHPERIGGPMNPTDFEGRPLSLPDNVALWPDRRMIAYRRSLFRAQ